MIIEPPVEFFYVHAGYSYDPRTETQEQGRRRCALALANAERWAHDNNLEYVWKDDPEGADVQNDDGSWEHLPAVQCMLVRPPKRRARRGGRRPAVSRHDGTRNTVLASLCGITESDNFREAVNYRRVVEAELALEAMPEARDADLDNLDRSG